jgi:integral membrane protein (TIGR01906 family)
MEDVKDVTQVAFAVLLWGGLAALVVTLFLGLHQARRVILQQALMTGSILTLSLIGAIVLVAIVAWNTFFDAFHDVFFESGTWRFNYSDTLIRLFPEQFWFDAALAVGVLTTAGALLLLLFTWHWGSKESST